ncbi:MAG: V-type ATP synthase subunit F [Clostridia bacterium]
MLKTGKIAVIGDKDLILAFKAIGMDVFSVNNIEETEKVIKKLAKEYAVIFVTEDIAINAQDIIVKYKNKPYPAIIPIPSSNGTNGFGIDGIKKDVEKAVGTDILFNRED